MDFVFESDKDVKEPDVKESDTKETDIKEDSHKPELLKKLEKMDAHKAKEFGSMCDDVNEVTMVIPPKIRGMLKVLEGNGKALMKSAVAGALKGNVTLLKFCLDRLLPEAEYMEHPTFSLPSKITVDSLPEIAGKVVRLVSTGHLSSKRGKELAEILQVFARTIEITRTENRLRELEEIVKSNDITPVVEGGMNIQSRTMVPAHDHFLQLPDAADQPEENDLIFDKPSIKNTSIN